MTDLTKIRAAKRAVQDDLLRRPGITAVDVGPKIVAGKRTDQMAIRVFVAEKKKRVAPDEKIPEAIEGIKTDVIQMSFKLNVERMRQLDVSLMADTTRYTTLRGGIGIGPCRAIFLEPPEVPAPGNFVFVGTLGAMVRDNGTGDRMMLTNFHVAAVNNAWSAGDTIAQPSRVDGGTCPADVVGTLERAVITGTTAGNGPGVDGAVIRISDRPSRCEIVDIGVVRGTNTATLGMAVRKRGRTTGLTHGTVDSIDLTVSVPYGDGIGTILLDDQIGIDADTVQSPAFGLGGDSGSVVVDANNRVLGLYFAGNNEQRDAAGNVIMPEGVFGIANPIAAVEAALNVRICVGGIKPIKELLPKEFKIEKVEVKEFLPKELKIEKLEKLEKREIKEGPKELGPKESKEIKEGPKEIKEGPKELGPKEIKEGSKEFDPKEIKEGGPKETFEKPGELPPEQPILRKAVGPMAGPIQCASWSVMPVGPVANPLTHDGNVYNFLDHVGNPWLLPRVVTMGGFTGLDMGFQTRIKLGQPVTDVILALVHFAQPARVEGYDQGGQLVAQAQMSGPQQQIESLVLQPQGGAVMQEVVVIAPQDETLLVRFCWTPAKGKEKAEKLEFEKAKHEKFEKPEKLEKEKREKEKLEKEKPEKFEKAEKQEKDKIEKIEKPEGKEVAPKEFQPKELKPEQKEFQPKEGKPEAFEGGQPPLGGQPPFGGGFGVEQRLAALESALEHFIGSQLRPDLSQGALRHEPDQGGGAGYGVAQQLQKQASDAKALKDDKDMEKMSDR